MYIKRVKFLKNKKEHCELNIDKIYILSIFNYPKLNILSKLLRLEF